MITTQRDGWGFIRYLFQSGVSQSRGPAPLNCASILTLHDSVELFLQLASEHLNAGTGRPSFMDYWDTLNPRLAPLELEQKESMRRLNKARVALKHHGTLPSDLDIESFRASTMNFFQDNTPLIFGIELDQVSLIEFVNPESARARLRGAQESIRDGRILDALDGIAMAYTEMISDYEDRKRDGPGLGRSSPFYFGRDLTSISSSRMGLRSVDKKLADFVDRVKESLEAMQDAMKVLALGIDYRKYSRFKRLTPRVLPNYSGGLHVVRRFSEEHAPLVEDARFCLDFVVESALALLEFDYSVAGHE